MHILPKLIAVPALLLFGHAYADTCKPEDTSAEYKLVFEDNFDSGSLDRNKWDTEFLWGPGIIINNEQQYYVNEGQFGYDPFTVSDGKLLSLIHI